MTPRASYASDPDTSRGRLYPEPRSKSRTPFARDRDRIIHSTAFRRLKEKTQVFVAHEGDHYRTRLTHSLEVAQIARSLAAALGLDADLAEAVALAHDLGHPPFGHVGEEALEACMEGLGGFDHNVQTFRVVTKLERRYPAFDGLNLTWETLEGIIKHNGPVASRLGKPAYRFIASFDATYPLELGGWAGAEAQLAAIADDIAYNNHDVDDGVAAGLFGLDELAEIPLIGPILRGVRGDWPSLDARLTRLESVRRMIGAMIDDVLEETRRRLAEARVQTSGGVRAMNHGVVGFTPEMTRDLADLRLFLHTRMYRHYLVNRMRSRARRTVTDLFELFMDDPSVLPTEWFERLPPDGEKSGQARVVCDYIGGMTDRYAIEEHRRLFNVEAWG